MSGGMRTMKQRVSQGAVHMDAAYPGWVDRVPLHELNMSSPWFDVLHLGCPEDLQPGVAEESVFNGYLKLYGYDSTVEYGFCIDNGEEFIDLTSAWKEYIKQRRSPEPQ